jgi:hypothetical protein
MAVARLTQVLQALEAETCAGNARPYDSAEGTGFSYRFGQDRCYEISIANSRESREEAWALAYQAYLDMGYIKPNSAGMRLLPQDAAPATTMLLIRCSNTQRILASLTFMPDGPFGLPMEKHHPEEIRRLRESGAKLCEIGKLVSFSEDTEHASSELLMHAFKLAYLAARRLEGCTDFVIEVRPHHVGYYSRLLLFERIGPERNYDIVNGKVIETVPLRLDLTSAEERCRSRFGHLAGARNLYRFFINDEEPFILDWLRRERRPMSAAEFRYFFIERTRIYEDASPDERLFLRRCHLAYEPDPALAYAEVGA